MDAVQVTSAEQLRQIMGGRFAPVSFASSRPNFNGLIASHDLGGGVALIDAHSSHVEQTPRVHLRAEATSRDVVYFGMHAVGQSRLLQHGRVATVAPGDGVMYESQQTFDVAFPTDMRGYTLIVPRGLVKMRSSAISERCAHTMRRHRSSSRLLCGYVSQLIELADSLPVDQRHDAGQVAVDLLNLALRDVTSAVPQAAADVLLTMMRTYVREHISDHKLDVAELARRHHISTRYAHTLFERIDTTPATFIREQRLRAVHAMLSDPAHDGQPITDIAAAAGFSELRTLQRSFRMRYGVTPEQWRRAGRSSGIGEPGLAHR